MSGIKAIETMYKGYRFRSRLEARWAVFFDYLNIGYQYEPEGFVLHDETHYLPDFYLQDFGMYIEVKPKELDESEEKKCENLMCLCGKPVVALVGMPGTYHIDMGDSDGVVFCWDMSDSSAGSSNHEFSFLWDNTAGLVLIVATPIESRSFHDSDSYEKSDRLISCWQGLDIDNYSRGKIVEAAKAARSSRFEHGETPFIR